MNASEALAHHLAHPVQCPSTSLPMDQYSPLMHKYEAWLLLKDQLEGSVRVQELGIEGAATIGTISTFGSFLTLPDSPKTKRPAWSGATKEYMAQKQRESRARAQTCACGKPKPKEKKRCLACQAIADEEQRIHHNEVKNARRQKIREGLNQRKEGQ